MSTSDVPDRASSIPSDPAPAALPKRRRRWPWVVLVLILFAGVTVAMTPAILSSSAGRGFIEGKADDAIAGSVKIGSMSLSWFGGQSLGGVMLLDPEGKTVLTVKSATTDLSIWKAITGDMDLGTVAVNGLDADIVSLEGRTTNLERATTPTRPTDEPTRVPASLRGAVKVEGAKIKVSGVGIETPVVTGLNGEVTLPGGGEPVGLAFSGTSKQGDLSGLFKLNGSIAKLIAADGLVDPGAASPQKLTLTTTELPAAGIDGLLGMGGKLLAAVGQTMNVALVADGGREKLDVTLNVESPNLKADAGLSVLNSKVIDQNRPTVVDFKVTPELVQTLTKPESGEAAMRLVKAVDLKVVVDKLNIDVGNWAAGSIAAKLNASDSFVFTGDERLGEVTVSNLSGSIDAMKISEAAAFSANADVVTGGRPGKAAINGELRDLLDGAGKPRLDAKVNVTANLQNLPVGLADRLGNQNGLLIDAVGESLDLTAVAKSAAGQGVDLTLNVQSANLTADIAAKLSATFDRVSIADSKATFTATPVLMNRFKSAGSGKAVAGPSVVAMVIKSVEMPLGKGASVDALKLDIATNITSQDAGDPIALAIGKEVAVSLQTQPVEKNTRPVRLTAKSDRLDAAVVANITQEGEKLLLVLAEPGKANLTLSNDLLALAGQPPMLAGTTPMELTIGKLQAVVSPFALNSVEMEGKAVLERVELASEGNLKGAALADTVATLSFNGPKGSATLALDGKATVPGQQEPGPIKVDAVVERLFSEEGALQMNLATLDLKAFSMKGFPTSFADAVAGQNGKLLMLAGPTMDIEAKAQLTGLSPARGTVEAKVNAPRMVADAGLKLTEMIETTRPLQVKVELTPESYAALTKPTPSTTGGAEPAPGMTLVKPATITATVQSLRWPRGGEKFEPAKAMIDAVVTASTLELLDGASKRSVSIKDFKATASAPDLSKPLAFRADGDVDGGSDGTGKIAVDGTLTDLYTADGVANTDGISVDVKAGLDKFPVAIVDGYLQKNGLLVAALGPTMDLRADAKLVRMQGPVTMLLTSPTAKIPINAQFSEDAITLNETIHGELAVTEELSKQLFAKLSPIMKGVSKEKPVTFSVTHEGFRVPRKGFSIEKVSVPAFVLELGQVTLENDTIMKGLMKLLGRESREKMPGWFTPAVLKIENGKATFTRRLDILLDGSMHVATWGEADLTGGGESRYLQVLALTSDLLARKPFGLEKLGPNDVLRLPVRGTSTKPEINFGQATTDLGKLVAQNEAAKANPIAGALLGRLLKDVLGGPPVPKPSVEKFPWADLPPAEATEAAPTDAPAPEKPKAAAPEKKKPTDALIERGIEELFKKREK